MTSTVREVLREKKGMVEALGIMLIVMTLIVAVGGVVANYAVLSKQAGTLSLLSNEITNRAEAYAGTLNTNLEKVQSPSTARECSTTTQVCTQILSVTPSSSGSGLILRIQADAVASLAQSSTQDVELHASEMTHVTAIDDDNNNVWALTEEGLRFKVWALAEGKAKEVSDDELSNPTAGNSWTVVDDRAGIDSTGALWVWGKNDIGQAGIGAASSTAAAPQRVGTGFRFVATEDDRGYAIDATGRLWAWGKNTRGQLGMGNSTNVTQPTLVPGLSGTRFATVAAGKDNAVALSIAGDLWAAGQAQAGYADTPGTSWRALATDTDASSLAASSVDGSVALVDGTGRIIANGTALASPTGVTFTTVTKGGTASYALSTNGELYSWGQGTTGQLGQGAATSVSTPTKVPGLPRVVAAQGSRSGVIAVTATGELYYAGKIHLPYEGAGNLPQASNFTRLNPSTAYRQVAGSPSDEVFAIKDKDGNLLSIGGKTAGLWPMSWMGGNDQLVRMPTPEGFASYTWK